jgi:hypothetical protein
MVYLLAACVAGFILYTFPQARKISAIAIAIVAALIGIFILKDASDRRVAASLISPEALALSDVKLGSDFGYRLEGEVTNNSSHTLTRMTFVVTAYDCPADTITAQCLTVGQDDDVSSFVTVPGGQVRAFDAMVSLTSMPAIKHNFLWSYSLKVVEGVN